MTMDAALTAMITTLAGKAFIMLADSMPAPAPDTNYWFRWFYDFMQKASSHSANVGTVSGPLVDVPNPRHINPATMESYPTVKL